MMYTMKVSKKMLWAGLGLFTVLWFAFLFSELAPRFFPCEWFADDVGYMTAMCSPFDVREEWGNYNIELTLWSYLVGPTVLLGVPAALAVWIAKRKA